MMKYSHFSFLHIVFALANILFFSGCNGEKLDPDAISGKHRNYLSVTVGAENVSAESVVLKGEANLDNAPLSSDIKMGIMWSVDAGDHSFDFTKVEANNMEPKEGQPTYYSYSVSLTGLSPTSQYWYMSYLEVNGQTFFGELKVFLTSTQPVTSVSLDKTVCTIHTIDSTFTLIPTIFPGNATNKAVSWKSSKSSVATVDANGKVTAKGNGTATISVVTEDQSKTATCKITIAQWVTGITLGKSSVVLNKGMSATVSVKSLTPDNANDKSVIWSSSNSSIATVNNKSGQVWAKSSGTAVITATANDGSGKFASCSVFVYSNPTDLSANISANCYVVSSAGDYSFRATQGNSSTSVGSVSSVSVLWESYGTSTSPSTGSVINNVSYSDNAIFFSTPSTLKNGNAVIAAKDASGTILWSWHIWVCKDYNPASSAQRYNNDAGIMMDRNLGATSATPGYVGSLGLLYQWGRKDPFLGSSSISSSIMAKSTFVVWPSRVYSDVNKGTIDYAVKHPTTFIGQNSKNYDWYYTGDGSTDNNRWQSSKTIYDPCPPGWRVPDGGENGVWAKAARGYDISSWGWHSTNKGMNFSQAFGSASTIWYPGAGYLVYSDGSLYGVGDGGLLWSCATNGNQANYFLINKYGDAGYLAYCHRADGLSVRCQKE